MPAHRKYASVAERNAARLARERAKYHADVAEQERKRRNARAAYARRTPQQKSAGLAYYRDYLDRNPTKKRIWTATRNRLRRHGKAHATPAWANKPEIERIYADARQREAESGTAWHVDHIVPLKSPLVCGLHCEANLAVIPASENCSKRNRYWPDMPSCPRARA